MKPTRSATPRTLAGKLMTLLAISSLLLVSRARATELTDLGQGLGYLRVHSLDAAIKPLAGSGALVLDLRHSSTSPETSIAFQAALAKRDDLTNPLYILVGPNTPVPFVNALPKAVITLGIGGSQSAPRVIVDQSPEADQLAYDALESGTSLLDLISGRIEKDRYDEASLVQEFKGGNLEAHPPEKKPANASEAVPPVAESKPNRLTDRVLQRAVHLHRALQALKRG
jgi:hypothetical protein